MTKIEGKAFTRDGKPFFPVMGEYQYSRTNERDWSLDMKKMKALGINTIATYSFWIHHEEEKGVFDFSGNKNLREFLRIAQENGMLVSLRLGPWVHGEARNGGFPEWIYQERCRLRTNDPAYLALVRRYFEALYEQCRGFMEKDGGPVYAIQIENEYSQWGRQGPDYGNVHIDALMEMMKDIGFIVPIYLATGWGDGSIGHALPVWGAYAEAPWEESREELPPADGYLFSHNPNDKNIGSDSGVKDFALAERLASLPYATVELGSGIQMTHHRRPIIRGEDNGALALTRLGSGVVAFGYYVFHGGIHPTGKFTSMQEYRREGNLDAGFYSNLPEKDYDFQAAISQYGKVHESGYELKIWNQFAETFADFLVVSNAFIPKENATDPSDLTAPRFSFRHQGQSGFLFINQYVRHAKKESVSLRSLAEIAGCDARLVPDLLVPDRCFGAFPYRMNIGGGFVRFATATPFLTLNGKDAIFFEEGLPVMIDADQGEANYLVLSKEEARHVYRFSLGDKEYAIRSQGDVYQDETGIHALLGEEETFFSYPRLERLGHSWTFDGKEGEWFRYRRSAPALQDAVVTIEDGTPSEKGTRYPVNLVYPTAHDRIYLSVAFEGDSIDLLIDGKKENDHFYFGPDFEIGLADYSFPHRLELLVHPLEEGEDIYLEKRPRFENGVACSLTSIEAHCFDDVLLAY